MNNLDYMNGNGGYYSASAVGAELSMASYISKVMRRVFGKMFLGVLLTAFVALGIASSPNLLDMICANHFMFFGLIIAQLGLVIWLSAGINKMSTSTASLLFYLYSAVTGVTLTPILFAYTGAAIIKTFFTMRSISIIVSTEVPGLIAIPGIIPASIIFWRVVDG